VPLLAPKLPPHLGEVLWGRAGYPGHAVTPPGALQADAGAETIYGERFALEEAEGQRYDPRRRPSAGGQAPLSGFAAIQVWLIAGVK
jgi:hypothetical protein